MAVVSGSADQGLYHGTLLPALHRSMKSIIAIDCETGGLDETKHALLSVGLVELDESLNPMRLKEVFLPIGEGMEVQAEAAKINGYSEDEWFRNGVVGQAQGLLSILNWFPEEFVLIAHNAAFDKKFFTQYMSKEFSECEWICTKKLYQSIAGDPCNLSTAAVNVGHWPQDYSRKVHGALIDALACAAVYKWCKKQQSLLIADIEKDSPLEKFYKPIFGDPETYEEKQVPAVNKSFREILDKLK